MADECDQAGDLIEFFEKVAIAEAHARASCYQPGIGICINCGVDVDGDRRWCSVECRDDFEDAHRRRV